MTTTDRRIVSGSRPKHGKRLSGVVSVVCGRCGRRGATNKALGYRQGQKIEACVVCQRDKQ